MLKNLGRKKVTVGVVMKLIVGLGNIGKEYENTNHNAGFMVLIAVAKELGISFNKRGCEADYAEYKTPNEKFIFAMPRTYMNESGRAVKSLTQKFGIKIEDVLVVVDDIDQASGEIRIRKSGSVGTHNGLKSIIAETNSTNFARLRLGIGKQNEHQDLANYVLSRMKMTDSQKQGLQKAADAVKAYVLGESIDSLMTKFNGKSENNGTHK